MIGPYSSGEILLADVVFSSQVGSKKRPVVVIHDSGDNDLLVAPLTSHAGRGAHDIPVTDWQQGGLRLPSVVRLEKLATINRARIVRSLGQLSSADRGQLKSALNQLFNVVLSNW